MAQPIETVDIETNQVEEPSTQAETQVDEAPQQTQQQDEPTPEQTKAEAKPIKARGHRPKQPDKPDMRAKTTCPDCNKQVSLHTLKFKHAKTCKGRQPQQPRQSLHTTTPQPTQQPEQYSVLHYAAPPSSPHHHHHLQAIDTHAMVIEHVRAMKQQKREAKQTKYKQLLAGKI